MPPKALSVAAQMKKEADAKPNREPTVRLRVLPNEKGFYGYPVASIITEGVEFNHRIKDLELSVEPKKGEKPRTNYGGKPMRTVEIKGVTYCLPAWCESAKDPSSMIPKEEVDETFALVDDEATAEM